MDDLLDIYDDIASGDLAKARRRLRHAKKAGADPETIKALNEFMDAPAGALTQGHAVDTDLTHPGRVMAPRRDAIQFSCLVCGHTEHHVRNVPLHRRWTSLRAWDTIDRSARTYGCADCGHLAWFGPAAPGAFQTPAQEGEPLCRCCGHDELRRMDPLFTRRGWAWLRLQSMAGAAMDRCLRCGHLHWSAAGTPWHSPPAKDGCLGCGGQEFTRRRVAWNQRTSAFLGLDWAAGLNCLVCRSCGAMRWQAE